MPVKLRPGEIAFYPQPFVESEPNLLVITNQRVVQFGEAGHEEVAARDVGRVGRASERPLLVPGIVAMIAGLPLFVCGLYLFLTVKAPLPGVPALPTVAAPLAAAAPSAEDDPSAAAAGSEATEAAGGPSSPGDPLVTRIAGAALALVGLFLLGGGVLGARRERHYVMVRGGERVMRIVAADKMQQNQIVMVVQAAQSGAQATGGAPAPAAANAKPAATTAPTEDKGDPVKALQELAAARQAGKVSEDEFQARRATLLDRIRART